MRVLDQQIVEELKRRIPAEVLLHIRELILYGSRVRGDAADGSSNLSYLILAMKYRKLTRSIARHLPLDIIPLKTGATDSVILDAIGQSQVIYER